MIANEFEDSYERIRVAHDKRKAAQREADKVALHPATGTRRGNVKLMMESRRMLLPDKWLIGRQIAALWGVQDTGAFNYMMSNLKDFERRKASSTRNQRWEWRKR